MSDESRQIANKNRKEKVNLIELQSDFINDLKSATGQTFEGLDPRDLSNPWAVVDNYIDRVVVQCVDCSNH